jgi:hypothetical protein
VRHPKKKEPTVLTHAKPSIRKRKVPPVAAATVLGTIAAQSKDAAQERGAGHHFSQFTIEDASTRSAPAQFQTQPSLPTNNTGLPDTLKSGIESLSGISFDNVKVHYNSPKPQRLAALAYAQGRDIHVAPGQERYLPHEAWHVVQQAQGRVKPTMQMNDGLPINDDDKLEREADMMGARALRFQGAQEPWKQPSARSARPLIGPGQRAAMVVQREPSDAEKELFRGRVGDAYQNYRFQTLVNGRERAIGVRDYYMLIRPQGGRSYWRKYKLQQTGGRGFYGRLTYNPPGLGQIAENRNLLEVLQETPMARFRQIDFSAARSVGNRDNNNTVMGRYFLNTATPMPASVYALKADCEWLHMQGHGLGGGEVPENLYAGSNAANSQMAAIEGAVQVMRDMYGGAITIRVRVSTDEDYHNEHVCARIAADLGLSAADVYASMKDKESRMIEYIEYSVAVNGESGWTEHILPFQEGRFDEGQFNQLNRRVMEAIQGQQKPIAFVAGGVLPGSGGGGPKSDGGGDAGGAAGGGSVGSSAMVM